MEGIKVTGVSPEQKQEPPKVPQTPSEKVAALTEEQKLRVWNFQRPKWLEPGVIRERLIQGILGITVTPEELWPKEPDAGAADCAWDEWKQKYLEGLATIHAKLSREASLGRLYVEFGLASNFYNMLEAVFGQIGSRPQPRPAIVIQPVAQTTRAQPDYRGVPSEIEDMDITWTGAERRCSLTRRFCGTMHLSDYCQDRLANIKARFVSGEISKAHAEDEVESIIKDEINDMYPSDCDEDEGDWEDNYDDEYIDEDNACERAESLVSVWEDDLEEPDDDDDDEEDEEEEE